MFVAMDTSTTADEAVVCSICYDELSMVRTPSGAFHADNAMKCSNGHTTCLRCVSNLTIPSKGDRSGGFSGFVIKCPLCRDVVPLDVFRVLCVMRNSVRKASEEFPCVCMLNEWATNGEHAVGCPNHHSVNVTLRIRPNAEEEAVPNVEVGRDDEPTIRVPSARRRSARLASQS